MNPILETFIPTANAITGTFGGDCEVVIHDLTTPENSVVYVSNGTVTGRKPGQSFDHLVKQVLLNKNFKNDCVTNYTFTTKDGKNIKSSSSLIRDAKGEVIGMVCINVDITKWKEMQKTINDFLLTSDDDIETEVDVNQNVMDIIDELIDNIVAKRNLQEMNRKECVEVIRFMNAKGIFLVKGAIDRVANLMGVSKVTIYSYLDEVKKTDK